MFLNKANNVLVYYNIHLLGVKYKFYCKKQSDSKFVLVGWSFFNVVFLSVKKNGRKLIKIVINQKMS